MPKRIVMTILAVGCTAAACSQNGTPTQVLGEPTFSNSRTVDGIEYRAAANVRESFPVQILAAVTLTNTADEPARIELPGGCTVLLRAYRDADRSGSPAWDQARSVACTMQLLQLDLAPGDSTRFDAPAVRGDEILGDSLPDGRYYLSAVIRPDRQVVELAAGFADLAAPDLAAR